MESQKPPKRSIKIRLLEVLKEKKIEAHLITTPASEQIIPQETSYSVKEVKHLATSVYENQDVNASISSGSFKMDGMVIISCSIKGLSCITHSHNENLLTRRVDVNWKERTRLVL